MTKGLHILHVGTERTWRGGEQQMLYLAQGLSELGQRNTVACTPGSASVERLRQASLDVWELPMRGEMDVAAAMALRRFARRQGVDVMHAHTSHAHMLVALAGRAGIAARIVSRRVDFTPRRGPLGVARLKYRIGVDQYVAISVAIKEVLIRAGVDPLKVTVVRSGVDPDLCEGVRGDALRADLGLPNADIPIVGTVAALAWHKGLMHLIEAAALLAEAVPGVKVVILGEGEERAALQSRVKRLGLQDTLLLPGFLPRVPEFLRMVDVYVAPSVMEGLNTSLADAMAAGLPVVASAVGGIPELVHDGDTGVLVPPGDARLLADAVRLLLRRPETAQALGQAARQHVREHFSVSAMVDGNLEVYRRAAAAVAGV